MSNVYHLIKCEWSYWFMTCLAFNFCCLVALLSLRMANASDQLSCSLLFTSCPYPRLCKLISNKLLIWLCIGIFLVFLLLCYVFLGINKLEQYSDIFSGFVIVFCIFNSIPFYNLPFYLLLAGFVHWGTLLQESFHGPFFSRRVQISHNIHLLPHLSFPRLCTEHFHWNTVQEPPTWHTPKQIHSYGAVKARHRNTGLHL